MALTAEAAAAAVLEVTAAPEAAAGSVVVVAVFEVVVAGAKGQRGDSVAQATFLMRGSRRLDMGRCPAPSVTLRDCGPRFFCVCSALPEKCYVKLLVFSANSAYLCVLCVK
jgi:hypothetical protein